MADTSLEPVGWTRTTLGDVASYKNGYPFTPADWSQAGLPIIRIAQMSDSEAPSDYFGGRLSESYRIANGDLLFSWSATLMTLVWDRGPAYVNQHIFKVLPRDGIGQAFLHHLLDWTIQALAPHSHGTTMRHIKRSDLLPFEISLPPRAEQRLIAQVLDTVDEIIRKTEQLVAKLKLVKVGLLLDLLTRGIDWNGELRDPKRHPEHFKETQIGQIPREWTLTPLAKECEHITKGSTPTTFGYSWAKSGGFLFLRSECVREGCFSLEGAEHISTAAHRSMARSVIKGGDVLMTITGYIGRSCRYPKSMPEANINQHIARIRPRVDSQLNADFLVWALQDPRQRRLLERDLTGLAYPQISLTQVRSIQVPTPSESEQRVIARILNRLEETTSQEEAGLTKLRLLKSGLLNDLLSGRVRVTPLVEIDSE